jgi:hypothetical protein
MSGTKNITLQLEPDEYASLEAQANKRGLPTSTLAHDYVRVGLQREAAETIQEKRDAWLDVLERFAALRAELRRAGYPSVDAMEVARASREDLEQRYVL